MKIDVISTLVQALRRLLSLDELNFSLQQDSTKAAIKEAQSALLTVERITKKKRRHHHPRVVIDVHGGVATVLKNTKGIAVKIIDRD